MGMNKLNTKRRSQVVRCLVEGNSIRGTVRITGVAKKTVSGLLVELGAACLDYQDQTLFNLPCKQIQCDEMWSFCYARPKNLPEHLEYSFDHGDVWTWTALCAETKLMVTWHVGKRTNTDAHNFIADLQRRMAGRIQLSADGFTPYISAIKESFGQDVDFGQLIKLYKPAPNSKTGFNQYQVTGIKRRAVTGYPLKSKISTAYVERNNLTMRMGMRRFMRSTNAFSKKIENLRCAVALHFMYYNFVRVHQTLKTMPAVKAGVCKNVWTIDDMVSLLG